MKIITKILKIILVLFVVYYAIPFGFVCANMFWSWNSRENLKGKIVYSFGGLAGTDGDRAKIVELPSCRSKTIFAKRLVGNKYIGEVNEPAFSPDGKEIIFSQMLEATVDFRHKLYTMDTNGESTKLFLDAGAFSARCPSWSPDGKSIAFIVEDKLYKGLYVVDADNPDNPRKIIDAMPVLNQPSWSADSKMIAFAYEKISTKYLSANVRMERQIGGIYVVDVKTGQIRRHIPLARQPAWSPKEDLLVFERDYKYYLMNVNDFSESSEKYLLSNNPNPFGDRASRPITWSPDGKYIAFWREIWPGLAGLYVAEVSKSGHLIMICADNRGISSGMSWSQ